MEPDLISLTSCDDARLTSCDDALAVVTRGRNPVHLQLMGELDVVNAEHAAALLISSVAANRRVIVDLQGLTFIDSAGVRVLERLIHQVDGGGVALLHPSRVAHRLLDLSGIAARAGVRLYEPGQPLEDLPAASPAGGH